MRHLYLVAIVAATAVAITLADDQRVEIPTECPEVDGDYAVHIADPTDCTRFYKCDHGVGVSMGCPLSNDRRYQLCFNTELQVCDWPWNVTCCNGGKPPTFPTTSSSTTRPTPTTSSTARPTPTTSSTTRPTPTTSSTTQPPPIGPGRPGTCPPYGFVKIAHETDCTLYYDCERGRRLGPYHCREGLFFNPVVGQCDRPENVPNCPYSD